MMSQVYRYQTIAFERSRKDQLAAELRDTRERAEVMTDCINRLYAAAEAGKDGYPLAWHQTIKHAVREDAGHRCVRCRHPYKSGEHGRGEWTRCDRQCTHRGPYRFRDDAGEWQVARSGWITGELVKEREVEAAWRILTVHHLDEVKLNCRWWNLAALCQRCHLTIQGRVKLHRPYFLEHSDWFKPYAAGFYASTILCEELTREEVTGRLEELLALATRDKAAAKVFVGPGQYGRDGRRK